MFKLLLFLLLFIGSTRHTQAVYTTLPRYESYTTDHFIEALNSGQQFLVKDLTSLCHF